MFEKFFAWWQGRAADATAKGIEEGIRRVMGRLSAVVDQDEIPDRLNGRALEEQSAKKRR